MGINRVPNLREMESGLVSSGSLDDTDWKSYEVDDETLEDIEISLYGMLHHAANEEIFLSTSEPTDNPIESSTIPTILLEAKDIKEFTELPRNGCESPLYPSNPTNTKSYEESALIPSSPSPKSTTNRRKAPFSAVNLERNRVGTSKSPQKRPSSGKCNSFSEYVVIEHCADSSSSRSRQKPSKTPEIIEISDDEDSKYRSISKIASKKVLSKNSSSEVCEVDDSSDTDSSVVVMNATQSSSDSESESEPEVIESSTNGNSLKLNIRGYIEPESTSQISNSEGNHQNMSSHWQKYSCHKWTQEMIEFYDKHGEDQDLEMIAASLPRNARWFVDNSDRFGDLHSLRKNRYFATKSRMRCMNCNQWDHIARECTEPKKITCCQVCGDPGHTPFQCPKKVCFGCGRSSKIYIECCPECRRERNAVCLICKLNHLTTQCPDLWRRYHMTTTPQDQPTATTSSLKPDHLQKCYLCAGSGHLPFNCKSVRPSKYLLPNPAVIQYEDSCQFLDELTGGGQNSVVVNDPKSIWVVGAPTSSSSYSRSPKVVKYSISDSGVSSKSLDSARHTVLKSIGSVNIEWRRQPKKGRFFVEFSGHGDTMAARNQFKKLITFKRDKKGGEKKLLPAATMTPAIAPTKEVPIPKNFQKITVIHRNVHNKQLRCTRQLCLSPREQNRLGKLLTKLESRYRVAITSSKLSHEWEIFVNSRKDNDFPSVSASSSCIINHLNKCS